MDITKIFKSIPKIAIADVGASMGEVPSYKGLIDRGLATLIGFEPDAKACDELNKAYQGTHKFYPYFIGDGKEATYHETNWVATGSLYPPNTPLLEKFNGLAELVTPVAEHKVQTTRLDDIKEIVGIDFLKMDIQGGELSALMGGQDLIQNTLVIQVEVEFLELYKGQPMFADVDSYLRSQGFQFHCFNGGIAGRTFSPLITNNNPYGMINQGLWADAFYVRDWMNLEKLIEDQLVKYALLSHDILRSPDLAHLVIQNLDKRNGSDFAAAYRSIII
jgi:FkbM family methyltransferase